jgi:demethylmenaquinone methyltransferase/2-methoxy-6-polyprenyl-1,4-benzoquinol methylase
MTHSHSFGFTPIAEHDRQGAVNQVFARVASRYDVMNDAMSLGLHRLWKRAVLRAVLKRGTFRHLDVAGGSGDVARLIRSAHPGAETTLLDINPAMLAEGRRNLLNAGITNAQFITGNAEKLPLQDNSVDLYTIAFGLRNVTDIPAALKEAARVLKPGGQYMCLEFTPEVNPALQPLYDAYSFHIIPRLGALLAKDKAAYQYLVESIRRFPNRFSLEQLMRDAGLHAVRHRTMSGGIVALHEGIKP